MIRLRTQFPDKLEPDQAHGDLSWCCCKVVNSHHALDAAPLDQVLSTSTFHVQLANQIQAASVALCQHTTQLHHIVSQVTAYYYLAYKRIATQICISMQKR